MGRKPKRIVFNGQECTLQEAAAKYKIDRKSISVAIRSGRYLVQGYPVCWVNDIHIPPVDVPPIKVRKSTKRPARVLLVDGVPTPLNAAAAKIKGSVATIKMAIKRQEYCVHGHSVCWADDVHSPAPKNRRRLFLVDGKTCTMSQAKDIIGCSGSGIYEAIAKKRYIIKGHPVSFNDDPHKPAPIRAYSKPCIVDDVWYKSASDAARHYGFIPTSFCLALGMRDMFKGHSISWADEE